MATPWRAFLLIFLVHLGVQGLLLAAAASVARKPNLSQPAQTRLPRAGIRGRYFTNCTNRLAVASSGESL